MLYNPSYKPGKPNPMDNTNGVIALLDVFKRGFWLLILFIWYPIWGSEIVRGLFSVLTLWVS